MAPRSASAERGGSLRIDTRLGQLHDDLPRHPNAAGSEIHLGRFFLMSAVVPALSGSTVPLCPRICLCIQVQLGALDALKAALALIDQLVQHPHTRIQIRVSDPVGMKQIELVRLRHLPGELLQLVEESISARSSQPP